MGDADIDLGIAGLRAAEQIGRGGNAVVYRAHDVDHDRWVAVKVLHHAQDEATLRRFDRERKTMGRLSAHDGIVTILTSGVSDTGKPYLVMPLLTGGSLEDELHRRGTITWAEAIATMVEVAGAVAAAHEANVVHRDLKPANILIGPEGRPLVADFGISQILEAGAVGTTALSLTPNYAAPDVLDQPPPHSIDLYALGATLYEMGVGAPPYVQGDDEGIMGFLRRVRNEPLPDLASHGLPDALVVLLGAALAKEAADRPTSMHDFATALRSTRDLIDAEAEPPLDQRATIRVSEPDTHTIVDAAPLVDWLPDIEVDLGVDDVNALAGVIDDAVRWALEHRGVFVVIGFGNNRFVQLLVEQNGDAFIETSRADVALRANLGWATTVAGQDDLAELALPLGLARRRETITDLLVSTAYRVHGFDHSRDLDVTTGLAGSASPVLGIVFEAGLDVDVEVAFEQELRELLWHGLLWSLSTGPVSVHLRFESEVGQRTATIQVGPTRDLTLVSSYGDDLDRLGLGWHVDPADTTTVRQVFAFDEQGREHRALDVLAATFRGLGVEPPCRGRIVVAST